MPLPLHLLVTADISALTASILPWFLVPNYCFLGMGFYCNSLLAIFNKEFLGKECLQTVEFDS